MSFDEVKKWFELLSYAATIIGIPMAILIYYKDRIKERKIREKEVLFIHYSLYVDYLKICLSYPELNVYISPFLKDKSSESERKELIVFEILFTYLESAYLYYKDLSDDIKLNRWDGWVGYIKDFSKQQNFVKAWQMSEGQWDKDFMKFMNTIIDSK